MVDNPTIDKNSKEAFLKKLQVCMKHYDYKDETKDVRGKVSLKPIIFTISLTYLIDYLID